MRFRVAVTNTALKLSRPLIAAVAVTIVLLSGCSSTPQTGGGGGSQAGTESAVFSSGMPESIALEALKKSNDPRGSGWSVCTDARGSVYIRTAPYVTSEGSSEAMGFGHLFEGNNEAPSCMFFDEYAVSHLFGASAAISADGTLAVIGAPGRRPDEKSYVLGYIKQDDTWNIGTDQFYPLWFRFPAMDTGWHWGMDVDLSGDGGTTVLIGAPGWEGTGRVYYYLEPPGGWAEAAEAEIQTGILGAGDPTPGDEFGRSVAISRDDSTIVIGAPGKNDGRGKVYVFKRPEGGWLETTQHFPIELNNVSPGYRFGHSVGVSSDGSVIAIGGPGAKDGVGVVHVVLGFDPAVSTDVDIRELPIDAEYAGWGVSVDVSGDGTTIAAGGLGIEHCGAVRIFKDETRQWSGDLGTRNWAGNPAIESQKGALLGFSLDLTENGDYILVGAPLYNNGAGDALWFDTRGDEG